MNFIERKPQLLWVIRGTKGVYAVLHWWDLSRSKQYCLQLHTLWYHMMISIMYMEVLALFVNIEFLLSTHLHASSLHHTSLLLPLLWLGWCHSSHGGSYGRTHRDSWGPPQRGSRCQCTEQGKDSNTWTVVIHSIVTGCTPDVVCVGLVHKEC